MTYNQNRPLTKAEMKVNAEYILSFFTGKGWTKQAVTGMLGNMETESTINPGRWESGIEYGGGYGLTQWTPYTNVTNWLEENGYAMNSIRGQCERIQYELNNNLQWIKTEEYPYSFKEFSKSKQSPETLASWFITNYERPGETNQPIRGEQARYWYDTLVGGGSGEYQLATFPMNVINITQGENGQYSHKGTLCIDFVGTTEKYPYYAPCDITCLSVDLTNAITVWKSNSKVLCADGETRNIVFNCIHDANIPHKKGSKLSKGELLGHTGIGGTATGDHLHMNVINGSTYSGYVYVPDPRLKGSELHLYDVFSITDTTEIINDGGYEWVVNDYIDPPGGGGGSGETNTNLKTIIDYLLTDVLNGWKY